MVQDVWRVHCLMALMLIGTLLATAASGAEPDAKPDEPRWQSLFDGRSLGSWKPTNFGGEGDVHVADGQLVLEFGNTLTGVTWSGELPATNYELRLEAMRLDGIDFFCCLTFPVGDSHCSLVVGGWAGVVVGLSSIDGLDASQNETTRHIALDDRRWYRIRLRVGEQRIEAWIDDERMVDLDIRDRQLSVRNEVLASRPLGIASWQTRAALRDIRIRSFDPRDPPP